MRYGIETRAEGTFIVDVEGAIGEPFTPIAANEEELIILLKDVLNQLTDLTCHN